MENELLNLSDFGLEKKLKVIWANNNDGNDISPLYQKEVRKNVVTFLSLNPSLPPNEKKKATQGNNIHPPFPMVNCNGESPNQFYNKYYEINKTINEQWTAIDLLYIRDSNQKQISEIYKTDKGRNFIFAQIQLTLDLVKKINPKLVVVSNRFVETILLAYDGFKMNAKLCEDKIYRYEGIPFIMRESGFMGSRRHWVSKSQQSLNLKNEMYKEIKRVIIELTKQESEKATISR